MANDYNVTEDGILAILRADSTLTALLGVVIESSGATLDENIDDTQITFDITGDAPTAGDVWKLDDELILVDSFSSPTATVTRGHLSTTASAHSSGLVISRRIPSITLEPRNDLTRYHKAELPACALTVDQRVDDEVFTMGEFQKTYLGYLEIIHMGGDLATIIRTVKNAMAEVERIFREQKDQSQPFSVADDVRLQAARLARGNQTGRFDYVAFMFTNFELDIFAES